MSRICQITGKKVISGHHVSHSNIKTKRKFHANLQDKKFFNPETGEWLNLRVSAAGIRTVNKIGLPEALKRATVKGYYKA